MWMPKGEKNNLSPLLKASATFQQHLGAVGFAWFPGVFIPIICHHINLPRWWFLKYFLFSPLLGEMVLFDYFLGMGWNHQLGWICMIPGVCIICHHINLPFVEKFFSRCFFTVKGVPWFHGPRNFTQGEGRFRSQSPHPGDGRRGGWPMTNDDAWRMASSQIHSSTVNY